MRKPKVRKLTKEKWLELQEIALRSGRRGAAYDAYRTAAAWLFRVPEAHITAPQYLAAKAAVVELEPWRCRLVAAPSAPPEPPPAPPAPPAPPWPLRMFVEEIATRIRSAMEEKNLSLFELAAKLRWSPARQLQWLDGSLAYMPGLEVEETGGGTLKELVQIGLALDKRWGEFQIGKGPMKEEVHG